MVLPSSHKSETREEVQAMSEVWQDRSWPRSMQDLPQAAEVMVSP